MKFLQPPNWPRPKGYANGVATRGSMVFLSGIVGWNAQGEFAAHDFPSQVRQALRNIVEILDQAKAKPEHIARMTWYVLDKRAYLDASRSIGQIYRELMGNHYPVMTAVQVGALIEDRALVEIEATAVLPE